jgi:hypothetical protein
MQVFFSKKHLLFFIMKKYILLFPALLILLLNHCTNDLEEIPVTEIASPSNEVTQSNNNSSSSGSSSQNTTTNVSFDHQKMLTNWADNIIIPSITSFKNSLTKLQEVANIFVGDPTSDNLSSLKEFWFSSYLKWQYVEMFDIGIAEEIYFKNRMNLYPVNIQRTENNISNKSYDLNKSSNFTSQGFSALDYLLFGIEENTDKIVTKYLDSSLNYGTYLNDVIFQMIELTNLVQTQWEGSYREKFIESIDNTATSSINLIINDFIFYYEKGYRAYKFGIPAGIWSGDPLPDRVEAYYGENYSKLLALEAGIAVDQFFNGKSYDDPTIIGLSLKHYLDYVESDVDDKLSNRINDQLNTATDKISSLNTNFKTQIQEDNNQMLATYDAIQKTVVMLKVDMLQKLNISIDYVDADGD